ncbi:hypothetical protein FPOA_02256 [Fusarium poae]|uniref:HNH nuclease domain-containing protein n=1 Tax=Fusarium poae TaxID=36050 RepID=A0A1B8B6H3_FUSPO|nr:hypothetical protein FPOA_02256 [Fusarium poae]
MVDTQGSIWPSLRSLVPPDDQQNANVKAIEAAYAQWRPDQPVYKDDIAVALEDVNLRQSLQYCSSGGEILRILDMHTILAKSYLSSTSSSLNPVKRETDFMTEKTEEIRQTSPFNKGVPRISVKDKKKALERDGNRCVLTKMANPEGAHIFPHSALGDSKNNAKEGGHKRAMTVACWEVTATMVSKAFHDEYLSYVVDDCGFEYPGNVVAIAPHMHNWLDRGFWSFRAPPETANGYCVEFVWLPAEFCDEVAFPQVVSNVEEYVRSMRDVLEMCRNRGYPARTPIEGWIGTHQQDGTPLQSGDVIYIQHETKEGASFFLDMIRLQWECMLLLTLRGVTKGHGSRPLDDDDDNASTKRQGKSKAESIGKSKAKSIGKPKTGSIGKPKTGSIGKSVKDTFSRRKAAIGNAFDSIRGKAT